MLVLGHGSIGRAVQARLEPFGATVTGVARHARPGVHPMSEAHALAGEAEVVVVLLPLTDETDGVVDGAFLDAMRPGALLVNAGRGRHVVTDDLIPRLRSGRVRAALDVTDPEPLPDGHPLWSLPRTAHHAARRGHDGRLVRARDPPRGGPDPAPRGGRTAGQRAGGGILTATHEVWVARLSGLSGVDTFAADGGPRALRERPTASISSCAMSARAGC